MSSYAYINDLYYRIRPLFRPGAEKVGNSIFGGWARLWTWARWKDIFRFKIVFQPAHWAGSKYIYKKYYFKAFNHLMKVYAE